MKFLPLLWASLWRKKIIPKLLEWDATQADKREYALIRDANSKSHWPELQQSVANTTQDTRAVPQGNLGY